VEIYRVDMIKPCKMSRWVSSGVRDVFLMKLWAAEGGLTLLLGFGTSAR
jgi:hypothetical protein